MTDLAAQLRAVEEAAEKATPRPWRVQAVRDLDEGPTIVGGSGPLNAEFVAETASDRAGLGAADAEFIVLACSLDYRAIREEIERLETALRQIYDLRLDESETDERAISRARMEMREIARAVLCPDPAGGER